MAQPTQQYAFQCIQVRVAQLDPDQADALDQHFQSQLQHGGVELAHFLEDHLLARFLFLDRQLLQYIQCPCNGVLLRQTFHAENVVEDSIDVCLNCMFHFLD